MNKDYDKVNFHDLRTYARSIGVKSPTTYSKKELIKKIKEVESGFVAPSEEKRGRPSNAKLLTDTQFVSYSRKEIMFEIMEIIKLMEDVFDKVSKLKD